MIDYRQRAMDNMLNIELVIKIPEEYYNGIKSIPDRQCDADMLIIKSGTPLPKGHGRLIDADAVKEKYPLMENDFGMTFNEGLHRAIDIMPTII